MRGEMRANPNNIKQQFIYNVGVIASLIEKNSDMRCIVFVCLDDAIRSSAVLKIFFQLILYKNNFFCVSMKQ
jgi:hypothetical protein